MLTKEEYLDDIDFQLLGRLSVSGRASWAELGALVGLSAPAAADRVRKLEEAGCLRSYAALLEPRALGFDVLAFVAIGLDHPRHRAAFLGRVREVAEIQECHHVVGEDDYLLKVRCRDTAALEELLSETIKGIAGVARTRTTIVLSSAKETAVLPLPDAARAPKRRGGR